ncbi:hypothetical protein SD377_000281 [Cronobacter turicensis]|nr:hypothetical protein [Cronobacter turicensis]EMA1789687.1 hypothetical protein [Cronobacter turicensis]EMA1799441.1 hypothetical protein [Cronobacter turicensis]EMA1847903.1 hypothetical protein [Cronobacter turicensis]EMA1857212.1 hypothetical protein [Cronobacter turicensis]
MATLDAFNRVITHHTVTIDTRFRTQNIDTDAKSTCTCPIPTMASLANLIINQKGMRHSYDKGDFILTLQDAKLYTNRPDKAASHLALLINAVDKNGSTTVLKNHLTNSRVEISPKHEEGEGYEVSSHIIISLDGSMRSYDMSLTSTPGVSTARINSFLNRILFEVAKSNEKSFTANTVTNLVSKETNKPIKVLYKPVFEIKGKLDQELFNKINKEGLSDVVLMRNEFSTINAPDVNAAIIPKESTLRLVPNHGPNDVLGWLRGVSNYFKEDNNGGFDLIKVKFKEPDTGATRQVDFFTDNIRLDALEKTFIKKNILSGFPSRLKDSYDIINIDFVNKIIETM